MKIYCEAKGRVISKEICNPNPQYSACKACRFYKSAQKQKSISIRQPTQSTLKTQPTAIRKRRVQRHATGSGFSPLIVFSEEQLKKIAATLDKKSLSSKQKNLLEQATQNYIDLRNTRNTTPTSKQIRRKLKQLLGVVTKLLPMLEKPNSATLRQAERFRKKLNALDDATLLHLRRTRQKHLKSLPGHTPTIKNLMSTCEETTCKTCREKPCRSFATIIKKALGLTPASPISNYNPLKAYIAQLGYIYKKITGKKPGIVYNNYNNQYGGKFFAFVQTLLSCLAGVHYHSKKSLANHIHRTLKQSFNGLTPLDNAEIALTRTPTIF